MDLKRVGVAILISAVIVLCMAQDKKPEVDPQNRQGKRVEEEKPESKLDKLIQEIDSTTEWQKQMIVYLDSLNKSR
jgi:hypothetical protein